MTRDRPIYRPYWVSPIYRYRPKLASVGVDKMLLYSSRIQTTCARKHNEPSEDSYLAAKLAGAFSQTSRQDEPWTTHRRSQPKQMRRH